MSADPTVALVGAGPGPLDLLTLDAEAAVAAAREVVADRSLAPLLAALAAEDPGRPEVAATFVRDDADAIDALVAAIGRGRGVVRLYRGDPWAHPAGDAERASLRAAGVRWSTVAGVLPELAALAAAGIPAQVRDLAVTTTFLVDGVPGGCAAADLAVPADPAHALVVRTADLGATAARLVDPADDRPADDRPVALVPADGTVPTRATTADLDATAGGAGPGLVVVGLVAALDLRAPEPIGADR